MMGFLCVLWQAGVPGFGVPVVYSLVYRMMGSYV
jgi:hypothetical protein